MPFLTATLRNLTDRTQRANKLLDLQEEAELEEQREQMMLVRSDGEDVKPPAQQESGELITRLVEEARKVSELVCFIFLSPRHTQFCSYRLQELRNLKLRSYAIDDVGGYFRAFNDAVERYNPRVEAEGYEPIPSKTLVLVLCKGLAQGYDWDIVSSFMDEYLQCSTTKVLMTLFCNVRVSESGIYRPPWHGLNCDTAVARGPDPRQTRTSRETDRPPDPDIAAPAVARSAAVPKEAERPTTAAARGDKQVPSRQPRAPCPHCGRKGHSEDTCWQKYPDKRPKRGGTGHSAAIHATDAPCEPDLLVIQGWGEKLLADRGSGYSLITPKAANELQKVDPNARIEAVDPVNLTGFNGTTNVVT